MNIVVLGEGAWGSAIASVISHNGYKVTLWCYHEDSVKKIAQKRRNDRYCPYYEYNTLINPTNCLDEALQKDSLVLNALPMEYTRAVLSLANINRSISWVALNKGLECTTRMLPSELLYDITLSENIGVLMGPSFAKEVINKEHTFVNSAATTTVLNTTIHQLLTTEYFHVSTLRDMCGMQWCGVLKNCIALGMGLLQGACVGNNTQAAFMSKALNQLRIFLKDNGTDPDSLDSLAGMGDILLTSYGSLSKNNHIGRLVGAGASLQKALQATGYIPEAVNTLYALRASDIYKNFTLLQAIDQTLMSSNITLLISALTSD